MHKLALKLVFSNPKYIVLSVLIFVVMFVPLTIFLQYIFLEPILVFSVSDSQLFSFSLVVIISALTALVLSMGIYRMHLLQTRARNMRSGILGSIIGVSAGSLGCVSMSMVLVPILVPLASTVAIIEDYAIPLRLISIAVLGFTYFITARGIAYECKIKINDNSN